VETPAPRTSIADEYSISRIIVGAWQLSEGHSPEAPRRDAVFEAFGRMADAGLTTFDCADIYTGVEELLGEFRRRRIANRAGLDLPDLPNPDEASRAADDAPSAIQIHTKFVPDRDSLASIDKAHVERIIDRSLKRLGVEQLDLVQFAWWNYGVPRYVETALWLAELQQAGKIRYIGATNFDTRRLAEIVGAGVRIVAHQVQYSLLDHRPENGMVEYCREHDIHLLCYGSLAGGFLTDRWLGAEEPHEPLPNRSLTKYKLIIDEFGGWALFQELLTALRAIADKHAVGMGAVAIRYVLDCPQVAAAIVGARNAKYLQQNLEAFSLQLDQEDAARLEQVLTRRTGPHGDTFDLERVPGSAHAGIMRYNLNRG
jgi:aryl-alcohol dehydrogenase-like predicted oxidoreductase